MCLGGPQIALADVVRGPDPGVKAEAEDVVFAVTAELQQVWSGMLCGVVPRPRYPWHLCHADPDGVSELA